MFTAQGEQMPFRQFGGKGTQNLSLTQLLLLCARATVPDIICFACGIAGDADVTGSLQAIGEVGCHTLVRGSSFLWIKGLLSPSAGSLAQTE